MKGLYLESPTRTRIRRFDCKPGDEIIISVNVSIEKNAMKIDYTRHELNVIAAKLLMEHLEKNLDDDGYYYNDGGNQ